MQHSSSSSGSNSGTRTPAKRPKIETAFEVGQVARLPAGGTTAGAAQQLAAFQSQQSSDCIAVAVVVVVVAVSLWASYRCHNQKRYLVANSRIISSAPKCLSLGRLQVDLRLPGNQHVQHCQLPTCNFKLPTQTRVPLTAASAVCCLMVITNMCCLK